MSLLFGKFPSSNKYSNFQHIDECIIIYVLQIISIIHVLFPVVKKIYIVIYICTLIYELLEWSLPITLSTIDFKCTILMLSGFYTPAEFEKYMRYLEGPRKRQYESGDNTQAASSPRREPTSPVLLKRRRAKQASEAGTKCLFHENNTTPLVHVIQEYLSVLLS